MDVGRGWTSAGAGAWHACGGVVHRVTHSLGTDFHRCDSAGQRQRVAMPKPAMMMPKPTTMFQRPIAGTGYCCWLR